MEYSELPALPSAQTKQEATPQWQVTPPVPLPDCMQHPIVGYGMPPSNRPTFPSMDQQRFGHQPGYPVPTSFLDPIRFGNNFNCQAPLSSGQIPTLNCHPSSAFELISHSTGTNPVGGHLVSMEYGMDIKQTATNNTVTKNVPSPKIENNQNEQYQDNQSLSSKINAGTDLVNKELERSRTFDKLSPNRATGSDNGRTLNDVNPDATKLADNSPVSPQGEAEPLSSPSKTSLTGIKETCINDNLNSNYSSVKEEVAQRPDDSPLSADLNKDSKAIYNIPSPNLGPSTMHLEEGSSNSTATHGQGSSSNSNTVVSNAEQNIKDTTHGNSSPVSPPMKDFSQFEIPPLPTAKARPSRRGPFKAAQSTKEAETPKQPIQSTKQSAETTDSAAIDLLHFVKQEPKESHAPGSRITEIINICEKHVFGQTSSIQTILNICSQATGFPGCERFCGQIINICNQILSETYQNSHSIIDLCKNLTQLDLTVGKKKHNKERQSKEPTTTTKPTAYFEPEFEDDVSDFEEKEDTKDEDFDWKDVLQNSDSEEGLNQEDDPDWSAYWEKKKETRSRRSDTKTKETKVKETKPKRANNPVSKLDEMEYEPEEHVDDKVESEEDNEESALEELPSEDDEPVEPKKKKTRSRGKKRKDDLKPKPKLPNIKGEFKCSECSKVFLTQRGYQKHENHHRNGFRITCEVCGVACPSPSHFKSHMRTHTGEKPYVCEVCGNSYAQMSTLKGHMLLHSDDRPAQCEYCEYNCKSEKRLRRHMIVHTSEKKFQCEDCGARFLRSASLKKHLQIHKDVWPFLCDLCPKKFKSKVHLRRHEEVHRDEYKYQCPVCGKRIRQAGNLKTHMRTHNGEKPYKCESCGKGFAHNVTRKQHQEQCRGHVEVLIQPPSENDYAKYNPALYMVGLKSLAHLS